jgi:hypothetical protein
VSEPSASADLTLEILERAEARSPVRVSLPRERLGPAGTNTWPEQRSETEAKYRPTDWTRSDRRAVGALIRALRRLPRVVPRAARRRHSALSSLPFTKSHHRRPPIRTWMPSGSSTRTAPDGPDGLVGTLEAEPERGAARPCESERNEAAGPLGSGRKEGDQNREQQGEEAAGRSAGRSSRAPVEIRRSTRPERQRREMWSITGGLGCLRALVPRLRGRSTLRCKPVTASGGGQEHRESEWRDTPVDRDDRFASRPNSGFDLHRGRRLRGQITGRRRHHGRLGDRRRLRRRRRIRRRCRRWHLSRRRLLWGGLLCWRLLGPRLFGGRLFGGRLFGGRLFGRRLFGGRLLGRRLLGGRRLGRLLGQRLLGHGLPIDRRSDVIRRRPSFGASLSCEQKAEKCGERAHGQARPGIDSYAGGRRPANRSREIDLPASSIAPNVGLLGTIQPCSLSRTCQP